MAIRRLGVEGKAMTRASLLFFVALATAVMLARPAFAAGTSVVTDPTGDAFFPDHALPAPAYQDIVQATVSLDGEFTFGMDLAAAVPDTPALPGVMRMVWAWGVDTDRATAPAGFPFVPGPEGAAPAEFLVWVVWDGATFSGIVIDRRPLLTGGEPIITSVPSHINGAQITVSVDAALLGSPSSFKWVSRTIDWRGPFGTLSNFDADRAPNAGQATWSS